MLLFATLLGAALQAAPLPGDTVTIVVAATTDVHGRVTAWDYEQNREAPLGLVRVATVVDSLRRAHPGRVLLVDAGDLIQGNPFATYWARHQGAGPHPILAAMNRMGYTAAAPGNHEFNFGLGVMQRALGTADFPYVSANIVDAQTRRPPFRPWVQVDVAGVKVGIAGATTPGVLVWDGPYVRGRLDFLDMAQAVPPVEREMRAARMDLTILVVHAGLNGESSYPDGAAPPEENVAEAIAAAPSLDLAVIGHSHREIADSTVGRTLVVQARNFAQSLAVAELVMVRERGAWRLASRTGRVIRLADVPPQPALVRAMQSAHDSVLAWVRRPIARATAAMPAGRARLEDTPVIDFINRIQMERTGAELSASAAFNPRGGIPAGPVTLADINSIYPYENTLRAVRISGADLRAYLERSTRYYRGMGADGMPIVNDSVPGYNFDIVSGVEYDLDLARPLGQRVVRLAVRGRPVAPTDSFTLAVNSYRQQGGGGFTMLMRAPIVYDRGESIRDILAEAAERIGTLRPEDYFTANWRLIGLRAPAAVPSSP